MKTQEVFKRWAQQPEPAGNTKEEEETNSEVYVTAVCVTQL